MTATVQPYHYQSLITQFVKCSSKATKPKYDHIGKTRLCGHFDNSCLKLGSPSPCAQNHAYRQEYQFGGAFAKNGYRLTPINAHAKTSPLSNTTVACCASVFARLHPHHSATLHSLALSPHIISGLADIVIENQIAQTVGFAPSMLEWAAENVIDTMNRHSTLSHL